MKIALLWASGAAGESLLKKFTDHGDFVYVYTDEPAACGCDSDRYEIQRGAMGDRSAMERVIRLSDVVVCMCPPQLFRGKPKDASTPIADCLQVVLSLMQESGKTRLFVTLPVIDPSAEQGRLVRAFGKFLRKFLPHTYRDVRKCCDAVRDSGLDYTVLRYMNPYLKHAKDGYVVVDGAEKAKAGVSPENLSCCLFDIVVADSFKGRMPVVYNRHQS